MLFIILAILLGIGIGIILPFNLPAAYAKYVSVSFLAGLDSVLGASRAGMKGKFNFAIFASGFVVNALLAALLTLMGDRMGVDLYIAAIVVFGGRIFDNLAFIRRDIMTGFKPPDSSDAQ
jgi:small basic protein